MKSCGTCKFWTGYEVDDNQRQCEWPHPPLPFWADINDGADHDDYTFDDDGKRCATWEAK